LSSTQTISLNGRRYDALTGRLLGDIEDRSHQINTSSTKIQSIRHPRNIKSVDGFSNAASTKNHNAKSTIHHKLSTAKKTTEHHIAPHINRVTQHSKTLMRDAVKKPELVTLKAHSEVAKTKINRAVARGVAASAPTRQAVRTHAQAFRNSEFVAKVNELTVPANPIVPNPEVIQTTANSEVHLKNIDHLASIDAGLDLESIFHEASLKLTDSHAPISKKEIRFYDALAEKFHISVRVLFISSIALFLIICGFLINTIFANNINIYLADTNTGIQGILPTYAPKGYGVQRISYARGKPTGTVDIVFSNSQSGQYYTLDEEATTWDSSALASRVVIPTVSNNFKTYQVGGRTVYVFNQEAVWVDAGIYYILQNKANLNNTQITQIVSTT